MGDGSWNRRPRSGYKVIFVPFSGGKPSGPPQDILTGFIQDDKALGRPVGVATIAGVPCSSPTMSATRCGALCRPPTGRRPSNAGSPRGLLVCRFRKAKVASRLMVNPDHVVCVTYAG